jgi:hypothetical protein
VTATKTKPGPSVPELKEQQRAAAQQVTDARAILDDIDYRQRRYDHALREYGPDLVAQMIDRPPTAIRRGGRYDHRVPQRPQPEDRARGEEVLLEAEQRLARVQRQLDEAGRFDPVQNARDAGCPFYAGQPVTLGDTKYLPGQPVPASAVVDLDKKKLAVMTRYGTLREV